MRFEILGSCDRHPKATRHQRAHDLVGMRTIARLDREIEANALERDAGEVAAMLNIDDVRAGAPDDLRNEGEHAGTIGKLDL